MNVNYPGCGRRLDVGQDLVGAEVQPLTSYRSFAVPSDVYVQPVLSSLAPSLPSGQPRSIKVVSCWKILLFLLFTLNIYYLFWLYRVFKELHTRKATDLSPGKAVGYMFIPLFNLVWGFVAWKKLGDAIANAYSQAGLARPATGIVWLVPISLFVAIALNLTIPPAGTIVALVLLSIELCILQRQMNRLAAQERSIPRK